MSRHKPNPDQIPLSIIVPETDWTPPTAPPDLVGQGVRVVALDTECRDDGLAVGRGPGWATGAGHVAGVSLAWEGGSTYLPLRHPDTECLDVRLVGDWLRDLVASGATIICQNAPFDWGWIGTEWGIRPSPEQVEDTIAQAVCLDENRPTYELSALCRWQGLPGKDERLLTEAAQAFGFGSSQRDVKSNIWRMPARFSAPYAIQDAAQALALWNQMRPQIEAQDLDDAYRLECDMVPIVVDMRRRGIRIDLDKAEQLRGELLVRRDQVLAELSNRLDRRRPLVMADVMSPTHLERMFTEQSVPFQTTPKTGRGSFQSDWMEDHPHWLPQLVHQARRFNDAAEKFVGAFILDYTHRGRIHAEIHSHRSDEGGTRSWRFSYSDPPLQQMPSPKRGDKEIGKAIRGVFIPEDDHKWIKADYSQQEFRLMVHFSVLMGLEKASEAQEMYQQDPGTDFHNMVVELTGLSRPEAKDVNFASAFGAGVRKFASMTGRSEEEAKILLDEYNQKLPFIKRLSEACAAAAARRGYIRLLDGARCRFDLWEPGWGYKGIYYGPAQWEEASRRRDQEGHDWHGVKLRRAFTHKAMNRLIQGSAARQTKMAMREIAKVGILPLLQLHDELDVSGSAEDAAKVKKVMEEVVILEVPVIADCGMGVNWAAADD